MTNYSDFTLSGLIPADAVPAESTAPCLAVSHTPVEHPPIHIISKTTTISLINPPDGKNTPHLRRCQTKVCPKCGVEKELTGENWYRDKSHKDGFARICKSCRNGYLTAWRILPHCREYQKRYRMENKKRLSEQKAKYYQANKEKWVRDEAGKKRHRESMARRYAENPGMRERACERAKQYVEKNRAMVSDRRAVYRKKPESLELVRTWWEKQRKGLGDSWIKHLLLKDGKKPTQDRIERKRLIVRMYRMIRRANGEIRERLSEL